MAADVRILLLADTHLGFDLPARPRVERRRRGHDFLANYARALEPALTGEVDLVVHGGDIFNRSVVASTLAYQALEPLRQIAERGIPVFVAPGNHERSRIPHMRFAAHPNVHVFHTPGTVVVTAGNARVAVAGFPYERRNVRGHFTGLLDQTRWRDAAAPIRLLCMHHCFEGATVGPADFTFTTADDVIRARDVPRELAAVLSGHIHRRQVLTADLARRPLASPVLYPGSIERTSFAEIDEPKGFIVMRVLESESDVDVSWEFRPLPARPMSRHEVDVEGLTPRALEAEIQAVIGAAPADAVISIRLLGALGDEHWRVVSARHLRSLMPETMNVEIRPGGGFMTPRRAAPRDVQTEQLGF